MAIDPNYLPGKWYREIFWNFRNPPTLFSRTDVLEGIPTWNPSDGFWFLVHKSGLPFLSYRGKHIEFYIGWRPSGAFGIAFRHANARGSEKVH